MQGDLEIRLFFFASAFLAAVEAMKAERWRMWAFWGVAAVFAAIGAGWSWLLEAFPSFASWLREIATSPQSWFALLVVALVIVAVTGRQGRSRNSSLGPDAPNQISAEELSSKISDVNKTFSNLLVEDRERLATLEAAIADLRSSDNSETDRQFRRVIALLLHVEKDRLWRRVCKQLLLEEPNYDQQREISGNVDILKERTQRSESFVRLVEHNTANSRWAHDVKFEIANAANTEDRRLKNEPETVPSGANAYIFGDYMIALAKHRAAVSALQKAISDSKQDEMPYLSRINEELSVIEPKRG